MLHGGDARPTVDRRLAVGRTGGQPGEKIIWTHVPKATSEH